MSKIFKKLYEKSSTGKIKHWEISVRPGNISPIYVIVTKYGTDNDKVRMTTKDITKGKNIGRSNETTPYEQAIFEAEATWKKKLDKGYVENLSDLNKEVLLPMLAHTFQKRGHNITYPCFVQPKLDGIRCLAKKIDEKTIKYYSRMGKEFNTLEHLTPDLLKLMKVDQVLDGEIYSHDLTFQEMIRLVKKLRPESNTLKYHVFDIVDINMKFLDRNALLKKILEDMPANGEYNVYLVESKRISCIDDVKIMHNEYVKNGYEGLILRNLTGMYKLKGRSADLQKYKEFQDEEFEIIGGIESEGSEEGCIIFDVVTKKGQKFSVRPRGSFEQRRKWMDDLTNLTGKKLTVRFQGISEDEIPRFPVGISIRDYEN